ncbi:MAG: hypothetical protein ACREPB_13200 [Arenimonas sp.]
MSTSPATLQNNKKYFLLFALLIFTANWLLVRYLSESSAFAVPEWPVGVDLLLLVPLTYLWLNRKQGRQAFIGAIALFGLGILLGSWILPTESKNVWLVLEQLRFIVLLGIVLVQAVLIVLMINEVMAKKGTRNLDIAVGEAVNRRFGGDGIAHLMSIEARMWLYALLRKPIQHPFPGEQHFHYHLHQGNASNQQAFLILIGAEIPIAHVLLHLYSPTLALFITATSIYGFIFLLAEYRATLYRPVSIDGETLHIRYGVLADQIILLKDIVGVKHCEGRIRRAKNRLRFTGPQHANVHLQLAPETRLDTLLGKKSIDEIYLALDTPEAFIKLVASRIPAVNKA